MKNATRNLGLIILVTLGAQNIFAADAGLDRQTRCMAKVLEIAEKDASGKLDGGTPRSQITLDGSVDSNLNPDRTVTMSFDLNLYGGPAADGVTLAYTVEVDSNCKILSVKLGGFD